MITLINAAWMALTDPERAAALALAKEAGRRQARQCAAVGEPERRGGDPWGDPPEEEGRPWEVGEGEGALPWSLMWGRHMRAMRPSQWLEEALDPRFCQLMASFQRERCRLRGTPAPPLDGAALEAAFREAKEAELRRGRDLHEALTSEWPVDEATRQQAVEAYEAAKAETDWALIFLAAALDF